MKEYGPGITWFDEKVFIGMVVTFDTEAGTTRWRLKQKLSENEHLEPEDPRYRMWGSDSRAVFVCSNLDESDPKEAIIKIHKQVPLIPTWENPRQSRALQATDKLRSPARNEINMLRILTQARCSSTPKLLAWKQAKQDWDDSWIPGGWVVYILMEKLPGVSPENFFLDYNREERDEIREAFKKAWLDCLQCGVFNCDAGTRNVIWDKEKKKCYMVDFEQGGPAPKQCVWRDSYWIMWGMAWKFRAPDGTSDLSEYCKL